MTAFSNFSTSPCFKAICRRIGSSFSAAPLYCQPVGTAFKLSSTAAEAVDARNSKKDEETMTTAVFQLSTCDCTSVYLVRT